MDDRMAPGAKIGHYSIVSSLGAGGMGEVFLAEDTKLKRRIALKVLPRELRDHPERLARFRIEAEMAAKLNHPGVAAVYSIEEDGGEHFITMEYVPGNTLKESISKGGLDLNRFYSWFVPLTAALAHAHDRGVIHRDLKPGNIMLTDEGVPKILDFGLACLEPPRVTTVESEAPTQIRESGSAGTPAYMSPEQVQEQEVDHRSDLFALGIVMYEALTGETPFQGESPNMVMSQIIQNDPKPLLEVRQDVPSTLNRIVKHCLQKPTGERYQSARDILWDLKEGWEAGEAAPDETSSAARKRRLVPTAATFLLVAAAAALASWFFAASRTGPATSPLRKYTLPMDTRFNVLDGPSISPDGKKVAYADRGRLWIRHLDNVESRPVPGTVGASHPFWSPESDALAYMLEKSLWMVGIEDGRSTELTTLPRNFFLGGTWGSNGTIVVALADNYATVETIRTRLYSLPARGGDARLLREADSGKGEVGIVTPMFLPDGKTLAYGVVRNDQTWGVKVGEEEKELPLDLAPMMGRSMAYSPSGHLLYVTNNGLMARALSIQTLEPVGEPFLIDSDGSFPSVSHDGTLVYKTSTGVAGKQQLTWLERDGRLAEPVGEPQEQLIDTLAISPEGERVVFSTEFKDVFVHHIARGTTDRFSFSSAFDSYAVWSPDGARILFSSSRSGVWDFFIKAADGSSEPEHLESGPFADWNPHWSRDGKYIVYHVLGETTRQRDIWYIEMNHDRTPKTFLETDFDEGVPQLSPDSRYLAYQSDESGRFEVYVKPFPAGEGKWQVSVSGGHHPRWSPLGDELFYAEGGTLMAVNAKTEPGFLRETPRPLFDSEEAGFLLGVNPWSLFNPLIYDVSPDGERFLVVQNVGGRTEAMTIVENWHVEFDKSSVPIQ
jgi:serine/threonine protein kinase